MSDPFTSLKSEFDEAVAAAALFFNNGHNKALRVEVPTIALEFTDGLYIGKDPEGILFYNAIDDFKMTKHDGTPVTHHYTVLTSVVGDKTYCTVEYRRDSDTDCYAKFLAEDSTGAVAGASMANYSSTGSWPKLILGSSIATVEKESANQTITIYADAIGKVGVWTAPSGVLNHKGFTVTGNLYFKNIGQVGNGIYANYNDDRIVFYQDDWTGTDFTAYFIPLESELETLNMEPASTQTFTGVAWSNQ
ncbi:hypothetical protein BDZ97DRAFT_2061581 [Flammula alnicola]|nr:hypothetical protein BDZ97DRAFT_2061581 [Flammula alnicola]